ncbi:hypothetical protein FC88_GL001997 [Companilactobacillus futsaii JCM 17355]|uniref:Uncharacterized protein n=1 Tax=Companilactobacillus futsaii JCM 17355 TaxID=1423818 RepID=A0ABR5P9D7_9LACO|nr:hypothetical protein FC88_GL001997 [Companilactobacillus futsaii JCM 17355]
MPSERPSLKTLPDFGLSKGSKSRPHRSSQIFFAMEDGILSSTKKTRYLMKSFKLNLN